MEHNKICREILGRTNQSPKLVSVIGWSKQPITEMSHADRTCFSTQHDFFHVPKQQCLVPH